MSYATVKLAGSSVIISNGIKGAGGTLFNVDDDVLGPGAANILIFSATVAVNATKKVHFQLDNDRVFTL